MRTIHSPSHQMLIFHGQLQSKYCILIETFTFYFSGDAWATKIIITIHITINMWFQDVTYMYNLVVVQSSYMENVMEDNNKFDFMENYKKDRTWFHCVQLVGKFMLNNNDMPYSSTNTPKHYLEGSYTWSIECFEMELF